ncbi:MAG: branched-chain amino acid ABC transporter permease [Rhodococcus sp.]|nr:branched-chain amino acid ABC transporter permease [Rhodococcus sp. (in: high G+C Gram-positive bacteria)]
MTTFISAVISGLGLGAVYSLIAVGFVIIFRATGVLNFAQPVFMIFGTYVSYVVTSQWGLPFPVAVVCAIAAGALVAMGTERIAMRPMVGRPSFAAALVTIGLFAAGIVVTTKLIGHNVINSGDPWGMTNICLGGERRVDGAVIAGMQAPCIGGVTINYTDIAKIVFATAAIAALGWWLGRSRYGLAMRATAMDQEVAQAQGIRAGAVFSVSWGIAGGLAALAGVHVGMAPGGVSALAAFIALKALPAIILGGLDSVKGAVIGGVIIGVVETLTKVYQPGVAPWLGANFDIVMPYLVMLIVLMIRPY